MADETILQMNATNNIPVYSHLMAKRAAYFIWWQNGTHRDDKKKNSFQVTIWQMHSRFVKLLHSSNPSTTFNSYRRFKPLYFFRGVGETLLCKQNNGICIDFLMCLSCTEAYWCIANCVYLHPTARFVLSDLDLLNLPKIFTYSPGEHKGFHTKTLWSGLLKTASC